MGNPTVEIIENWINKLKGVLRNLAISTGQSFITNCLLTLCKARDNIIAYKDLYGSSAKLFRNSVKSYRFHVLNNAYDLTNHFRNYEIHDFVHAHKRVLVNFAIITALIS